MLLVQSSMSAFDDTRGGFAAIRVTVRDYLNQAAAEWRKAEDLYP